MDKRIALIALAAILLAGCLTVEYRTPIPLTSPLPTPTPEKIYHTMEIGAYPGPQTPEEVDPTTELAFAYLPQIRFQRPPSILGWEAASDGQALAARDAILALYPATVRTSIPWWTVEPVRGAGYTWQASKDKHINLLSEGGNRIIGILNWPPQWAMVTPGCSPVAPEFYLDWMNYVRATVQRYGDRVAVWEIYNEPDAPISTDVKGWGCWGDIWSADYGGAVYGKFAAETADVIRNVHPDATIISGGLLLGCEVSGAAGGCTSAGLAFIQAALPWMEDSIDGVAFHSCDVWFLVPPTNTALMDSKVAALRKLTDLPLYNTEGGFLCHRTTDPVLCASASYEQAQAAYVALWAASCRRLGLSSCVWYALGYNGWMHADLRNRDGTPRLGYYVLQAELRK